MKLWQLWFENINLLDQFDNNQSVYSFLILLIFNLLEFMNCIEQRCIFQSRNWIINGDDGDLKSEWTCAIYSTSIEFANETVTTITTGNLKTILEVTAFLYVTGNVIEVIPNSIFTTFPNMKNFKISEDQKFGIMKPQYLIGAKKLRLFKVVSNSMMNLDAKLFVEAPNLERINLKMNKITSIDRLTFWGVPLLKSIFLQGNKIMHLHPHTFSDLSRLDVLDFQSNKCVHQKYLNASKNILKVEWEIIASCIFKQL